MGSIVVDQFPFGSTTTSLAKRTLSVKLLPVFAIFTFAPGFPVPDIVLSPSVTGFIVSLSNFSCGFGLFLLSSAGGF